MRNRLLLQAANTQAIRQSEVARIVNDVVFGTHYLYRHVPFRLPEYSDDLLLVYLLFLMVLLLLFFAAELSFCHVHLSGVRSPFLSLW